MSGFQRSVARELCTLRRKLDQANRRIANMFLDGKVQPGSQDAEARTVRLILGQDAQGSDILSPPVRWQQPGAGTFKVHATPADNEQMSLLSPSGTIGAQSKAVWGTYDDDHAAPSDLTDNGVIELGASRIELKDGLLSLSNGDLRVEIGNGEIVTFGKTRLNNGTKKIHRKGDLDTGGDAAVGSAAAVYA